MDDILNKNVKKNRITDIEKQSSKGTIKGKLTRIFSSKAFLLPFSIVVLFTLIIVINRSIQGGLWGKISDYSPTLNQTKKGKTERGLTVPELPPGNKELDEGKAYYLKGWYPAAQSAFERVINSNAHDKHKSVALTYLGMISYDNDQFVRAIDYFERALKYNDRDPVIYRNLALAFRARGLLKKALDRAELAIKLEPENSRNYQLKGNILFEAKDYKKSRDAYLEGLKHAPDDAMLLFNSALVYFQLGDNPAAINSFHLAARNARFGKVAIQSNINLGKIYFGRRDYQKATEYFHAASKLSPKDGDILFHLGNSQLAMGNQKDALKSFEKALKLGSGNPLLFENLGDIYMKMKLTDAGIKAYNKALVKEGSNRIPLMNKLAQLYYKSGNMERAEEINRKIISLSPGTNDARLAYINIGNILDDMEQYNQAIDMYKKASELDPTDETAWINMALSLKLSGKYNEARIAFQKAIRTNPENTKPRMALANLYFDQGFYLEAQNEYVSLLKMKPDFAPGQFGLANLYHKKNEIPEAIAGYREVLRLAPKSDLGAEMIYKSHLNIALLLTQKEKGKLNPEMTTLLTQKKREENFEQATTHAKISLQMRPKEAYGYFVLGQVYFARNEIGDLELAADTFQQLNAIPNTDKKLLSKSHNALGKCYFRMAKYPEAIREFSLATDYWPGNEEAALNKKTAAMKYEAALSR